MSRSTPLLSLVCLSAIAGAQSLDPIPTRNHRALSLAFLRLAPRTGLLAPKEGEWSVGWTEANDLRSTVKPGGGVLFEDYEVTRLSVAWRQGLSPGSEWGIEVPLMSRGGGFLDSIIDWWHSNILHWTSPLRDATPKNQCTIDFPDGRHFGSASGLGDVSAHYSRRFAEGVTATFAAKLPTGDAAQLLGSGGFDAGASVQIARVIGTERRKDEGTSSASIGPRLTDHGPRASDLLPSTFDLRRPKWAYGAQAGLVIQGKATKLEGSRTLVDQETLWLMWLPNSRDTWILQWQSEASPLRSGIPASDAAHRLVTFGWRRKLSDASHLEAFFSEDRDLANGRRPEIANIGPDFTIGLRLTFRK